MKKNTKRFAVGTMVAVVVGYIAGILTAPKSGKQTRDEIKSGAQKSYAEAEKELKKLQAELTQLLDEAKVKIEPTAGKARQDLQTAMDTAKQGKEKAGEILGAVRAGKAKDKDLQKVIADVQKTIEHLKKYLAK